MKISKIAANIPESPTLAITAKVNELKSQGKNVIGFGAGEPDFDTPDGIKDAAADSLRKGNTKYTPVAGTPELKEAVIANIHADYGLAYKPGNVIVSCGAKHSLYNLFYALFEAPDEVIVPGPCWVSYPPMIEMTGAKAVLVDTRRNRMHITADMVRDAITPRTRGIVINSPSNPTGRVEAIETLKAIEKITEDLGIYILSDEVYKDLIYVRENYLLKGPHVVTINSFSKTFAMTGLRVGYLWSLDTELVKTVIEMKSHTSMNTSIIAQEMAYTATTVPKSYMDEQLKVWEARRDLIYEGMAAIGLDLWKPEGAFYVLPRIEDPADFVWDMFTDHKVITYLGEWFGAPDRVRFSYALDVDKIEEGLARVDRYLKHRAKHRVK